MAVVDCVIHSHLIVLVISVYVYVTSGYVKISHAWDMSATLNLCTFGGCLMSEVDNLSVGSLISESPRRIQTKITYYNNVTFLVLCNTVIWIGVIN